MCWPLAEGLGGESLEQFIPPGSCRLRQPPGVTFDMLPPGAGPAAASCHRAGGAAGK